MARTRRSADDPRNRLRRAIFGACRAHGLTDDARHAVQLRVVGKESLTDMTADDMRDVLADITGNVPQDDPQGEPGGRRDALPAGSLGRTLTALWISAWHLGVVKDRRTPACCAFVRRQTGLSAARFATPGQMSRVIEALKDWMAREGGVDWSPYPTLKGRHDAPAARVLEAAWARHPFGRGGVGLEQWARGQTGFGKSYVHMQNGVLNRLIATLGDDMRKLK